MEERVKHRFLKIEKKTYNLKIIYSNPVAKIAIEKTMESHNFNLAMSVALRLLHDNKEIVLRKASDADMKDRWFLYEDNSHIFVKEITHVTYKGVKK